jgi:hypothetical protein
VMIQETHHSLNDSFRLIAVRPMTAIRQLQQFDLRRLVCYVFDLFHRTVFIVFSLRRMPAVRFALHLRLNLVDDGSAFRVMA